MPETSNKFIRDALELARKLTILADDGEATSKDDGCAVLCGVIRDCAYKIRGRAEREREVHRQMVNMTPNQKGAEKMSKMMMTILAAGLVAISASAGEGWLTDMKEAKKQAAARNVPILADFSGSDWCGWCIKLDSEVFSRKEFKEFAKDNLVLLLVDFPNGKKQSKKVASQNKALAEKYKVQGFPTVLLLDKEGNTLAQTGYRDGGAEKYIKHIKKLLNK